MTELDKHPPEERLHATFEYGRNLYVNLFHDDTPFVNLGYPLELRSLARRALYHLEEEGRINGGKWAFFGNDDESVSIHLLRHGGYWLYAHVDFHPIIGSLDDYPTIEAYRRQRSRFDFFETHAPGTVAFIAMLPADVDYTDIHGLVRHLYEGTAGSGDNITMEPSSLISNIKTHIFIRNAVYRAAWVDDKSKLELVVESNFSAKDDEHTDMEMDVWRRLPTVEYEGKSWTPFGKKPNMSRRFAKQALEKLKGKVVIGNLATKQTIRRYEP